MSLKTRVSKLEDRAPTGKHTIHLQDWYYGDESAFVEVSGSPKRILGMSAFYESINSADEAQWWRDVYDV